ncbi:hypothetical protein CEP54_003654 [Fusarium duplospermum]|uniref:Small s protein n=1 Tax=Fusarium duplospermum TaxID=1325734 RepID=A0A428QMD9_9HYPO|nr:hypothetical protein CEP54_003654 [Fusarium duplospermum]
MAEVAGLVLGAVGVVGVIGAFKDTIDLFNLVADSRHLTRDHEILATKLDIEKTLLLQWAEQVGLLSSNYDPRLDDPDTQRVVIRILKCIEVLLEDESKLTQRYGLCVAPEENRENGLFLKGQGISSRRWDMFVDDYKRHEKNEEKFESLVQELAHFITNIMEVIPVERANDYIRQDVEALGDLRQLKILLEASENFPKAIGESTKLTIIERCKDRILAKLWFRRIDDRRESIAIAHNQTLQWALEPPTKDVPWDDLSGWLRSGSGIYWVSGKAGSGKSTLMKYLYLGDRIRKLLSEWAKGEPYHFCNFFFMNLGTMEQKSQEGLSRTLLYQILSANRDLIPEVLPHMWKEMYNTAEKNTEDDIHFPSTAETKHAFEVMANSTSDVGRFCFLIDGLDEFAGSYMDGIEFLRSLAGNPRMKIIVSSRPIPACVAAFEDVPKLNLQDLNRSDIKSYVEDIIGSHKYMKRLIQRHAEEGREIVRDVIDKSSGVFLWVVLACRKLLSGFADHDRISELRRRVDELPPELEDMFQLMLSKIDKRHQMQTSRLLRLCYTFHNAPWAHADEDLYALGVALVDDYPDTTRLAHALEDEEKQDLCSELEGRLRSRCGGLLELAAGIKFCLCTSPHGRHDPRIDARVVFMHRTVFEFLSNEAVWEFECLRVRATPLRLAGNFE